jgi:hypothetical protein
MDWQPIKTAPKRGFEYILVAGPNWWRSDVVIWHRGAGRVRGFWRSVTTPQCKCRPTHWMPLPEPLGHQVSTQPKTAPKP